MVIPTTPTLETLSASRLTEHSSLSVVTQLLATIAVRKRSHMILLTYSPIILVGQATAAGRPGGIYGLTFTDIDYRRA